MSSPASSFCAHCRLPLPVRAYREEREGESLSFCCYGCLTVFRLVGAAGEEGRVGWFLAKLGLAAVLSGNVMLLQSLLYFGSLDALGADVLRTASWIMLVLSTAVYLLLGLPMLRDALRAARQGRIVLETLIALGALAAIGASAAQTWRGGRQLYYDSGTMVLVFVVLGQYLDARARQKATETLSPAVARARAGARVERAGREGMVPPSEVRRGERVRVRAGEEVPVDGRVIDGGSDVLDQALTGEAAPRLVGRGDFVHAGSTAIDGPLVLEASGESETLASRIERWTAEARRRRAPFEIAADRFVARFVPAVGIIAVATALGWGLGQGRWSYGALAALSVLVVACPCALGIATPMATTIALTRSAARGTLLRSGAVFEALDRVRLVAFDKTGTLTRGRPQVRAIRIRGNRGPTETELLGLAASVESAVTHPFARAIVEHARARGAVLSPAVKVRAIAGGGASGQVGGHMLLIGSRALLSSEGVGQAPPDEVPAGDGGASLVAVAIDGLVAGEIELEDAIRPEAGEAIAAIRSLGASVALLSGDRVSAVARVAREVGVEKAVGGLAPGQKPAWLLEWRQGRRGVAMVGDGINDGPALAAADAGLAFGAASGLARQTADAVILREDLREVGHLLGLGKKTMRIVRQNLAWAFAYNTVAIVLAALGFLRPVVAAAAMVLSSLFVVGNSLRLQGPDSGVPTR